MGLLNWLRTQIKDNKETDGNHHGRYNRRPLASQSNAASAIATGAVQYCEVEDHEVVEATISGPFSCSNLSLFFIHRAGSNEMNDFLTLEEALTQKKVIVEETGVVNQLRIKNSCEDAIFLQSGEIVKGGKQDRTIQNDMILYPGSDYVPINSFCVEQGRWRKRGAESETRFGSCTHSLAGKSLKMANRYAGSQQEVWNQVGHVQHRTALNAHVPLSSVQHESSPSSLELTLDNETVQKSIKNYVTELNGLVDGDDKADVVGFAFAINGQMNSIEMYSGNTLFKKFWSKLLKSAAMEAFCELEEGKTYEQPTVEQVRQCMIDLDSVKGKVNDVSGQCRTVLRESEKNVLFEARDISNGDKWVHRNYTTK